MRYKGIIIEESLDDTSLLKACEIISTEISEELGWHMHTVLVDEAEFPKLEASLKEGKWYAHFWSGTDIVAIFRGKTFRFDSEDKATWIPVRKYGQYLEIPEDQLDFPTVKQQKVYVFIDASNVWAVFKSKTRLFDYAKLTAYLEKKFSAKEMKVFYYAAYPAEGTRAYSMDAKHKFFVFLKKALGFEVRKKALKRIALDEQGRIFQEKGNMDVEMTIDAVHHLSQYDVAVFFTGDSDFLALVSHIRNAGKKAFVFSSKNNISQELRSGSDGYIDILEIEESIWGPEIKRRIQKGKDAPEA